MTREFINQVVANNKIAALDINFSRIRGWKFHIKNAKTQKDWNFYKLEDLLLWIEKNI